jgi:hypothetical protein
VPSKLRASCTVRDFGGQGVDLRRLIVLGDNKKDVVVASAVNLDRRFPRACASLAGMHLRARATLTILARANRPVLLNLAFAL